MKDNTLDASDVTTRHSNSKLNLTSLLKNPSKYKKKKFEMIIYRLIKNEKRQYPFSTIRETCVYINSLDSQNEPYFSLYPAELVNKNGFQLHIPKVMEILMSSFMSYITPILKPEICHLFELLYIGHYLPNYIFKGSVEKPKDEPCFKQQSIIALCKLYENPTADLSKFKLNLRASTALCVVVRTSLR